ncbi:MAG TPA: peptidoglycan DD-metalloendopeptidase family protein [Candidatus Eisenbacteria bacterium]|nr:peptidoglycan DD-metalloendopeptidase family protein [Candidatus Eisenbacteria bacterium]
MAALARRFLRAALLAASTAAPFALLALGPGNAFAQADSTAPPAASVAPRGADTEIEAQRRELESLKAELEQRRTLSKELKGREKNLLAQLRDTEKNLTLTVRYLNALERRRRAVSSDLGDATSELSRTALQLDSERRRLAWRLREIYKRGRSRDIEYVLSARSFGDLVARGYYLARVAKEDRQRMLLTQARRVAVQDTKTRLEERKRELDRLKRETDRERASLASLTGERRRLLRRIRSDAKSNEQAAAELVRASKRIQALIETLERQRIARERGAPGEAPLLGDFGKNKGRLAWPVNGKVARSFGSQKNARFGTTTFNSGVDIAASFGTPIAAVAKGRVEWVNWLEGFGRCAIINHGGGFYTLYAHASEITVPVGRDVAAGEVIGRVGDTGSTIGTALHFEIRRGKEALNPLEWLR